VSVRARMPSNKVYVVCTYHMYQLMSVVFFHCCFFNLLSSAGRQWTEEKVKNVLMMLKVLSV